MHHHVSKKLPLVEPIAAAEIVASSCGRIEFLGGGLLCAVMYREAIGLSDEAAEYQITGRVFLPLAAVPEIINLLSQAMEQAAAVKALLQPFSM